jgi:hypothetical protein
MNEASLKPAANAAARHKGAYAPNPYDWYVEPPEAVYPLLNFCGPLRGKTILDPCAGLGTIPACLRAWSKFNPLYQDCELNVTASDVALRDVPGVTGGIDFFACPAPGEAQLGVAPYRDDQFDWIISNPPYYGGKGPVEFFHRARRVARCGVAMLVNLPFLCSQSRNALFRLWPPSDVVILSKRPSMPPGEELRAGVAVQKSGKEDYCGVFWLFGVSCASVGTRIHWPEIINDYPPPDFPPGVFLAGG